MQNFGSHFPICTPTTTTPWCLDNSWLFGPQSCYRENTHKCPRYLWSFDYIILGLGRGKFSFKLTNLFSGSLWVCAGSFPNQPLFWMFQGFVSLVQSDPFHWLDTFPHYGGLGAYWASLSRGISPSLVLLPLHSPGNLQGWTHCSLGRLESSCTRI